MVLNTGPLDCESSALATRPLLLKFNELMNICYVGVRVSRRTKVNIKETFMGNNPFLQMFNWGMHYSQRIRRIT